MIEKAADLWGKAGLRSLERSAQVEAAEQLARALDQITTLFPTPALRCEQIRLQVALIQMSALRFLARNMSVMVLADDTSSALSP